VLVAEFQSNGVPLNFTARDDGAYRIRMGSRCPEWSGRQSSARISRLVPENSGSDAPQHARAFIQPLKERIVREVGYGLSLEGASAADLVKSMKVKSESVTQKRKST
jgi:hypothetical protein